jgi:ketosteroid isomerase-like protein
VTRRAVLLAVGLVGLSLGTSRSDTGAHTSEPGDAVAQIRALELAHNQALVHGDAAALEKMLADDFTFITTRGFLFTKAEMLRGVSDGAFRYEYRQIYDLAIRVYGDAAVVTGRSVHSGQQNGRELTDAYRFTRVYVHRQGGWLAVAWQLTHEDDLPGRE